MALQFTRNSDAILTFQGNECIILNKWNPRS